MYWFIQYSVTYCYICLYYNIIQHSITTAMPYNDIVACEISRQELVHGWTAFVLSRWEMRFDSFECVHHLRVPLHHTILQYYNIPYTKTQTPKWKDFSGFQSHCAEESGSQSTKTHSKLLPMFMKSCTYIWQNAWNNVNRLMLLTKMFHISACTTHKYPHHYGVLLPMMLTMAITSTFAVEVFTFNQCRIPRIIKLWSFANRSFFFPSAHVQMPLTVELSVQINLILSRNRISLMSKTWHCTTNTDWWFH